MASQFQGAAFATEKGRVVGVAIPDVGDICLEPGGQVELSAKPCRDLAELESVNITLRAALEKTASFLGLKVTGTGHMPSFLEAEDMPRSRFAAYCDYLRGVHGKKADDLIDTMKSCCGLQVNVDPMGPDFHEIYRALMLVDVANAFSQRTERQERLHETYAKLVPSQLTPVFEALEARGNEQVVGHIIDRLLTLKVPFMPDAASPEGFKSTSSVFGVTPTVGELLNKRALTTEILDNSLSLQLMMPNLRRHGVLETRAPDSPQTTEEVMKTARQYHRFAYDVQARRELLEDFRGIDPQLLKDAFLMRFDDARLLSRDIGGGKTVASLIAAIAPQSETSPPKPSPRIYIP
jgi:hypothetical protein